MPGTVVITPRSLPSVVRMAFNPKVTILQVACVDPAWPCCSEGATAAQQQHQQGFEQLAAAGASAGASSP
jgi:hypothetical protein